MPMRPERYIKTLASMIPRLDPEPLNNCLENQPHSLSPPPPTPPAAEHSPAPRRTTASQRPVSLVVRNARKPRNRAFYTSVPRSNHYLLAKSLVENDQPLMPFAPEQNPRVTRKAAPSQFGALPPDFTVSDFVWRFSAPDQDSQIYDAFAALRSCDPQTFSELVAGFD